MKAKEFLELFEEAKNESDVLTHIDLINNLCDMFGYHHIAKFKAGTIVGQENSNYYEELANFFAYVEQYLEDIDYLYDNIDKQYLSYLNDDSRKISKLKGIDDTTIRACIIASLKDNHTKAELLKQEITNDFETQFIANEIAKTINDDNELEMLISSKECENIRNSLICNLNSDENKLKYLSLFNMQDASEQYDVMQIICSLNSDDLKIKWMQENNLYPIIVVCSFKSDELKEQYMSRYSEKNQYRIIKSMDSDELKIRYLKINENKRNIKEEMKRVIELTDKDFEEMQQLETFGEDDVRHILETLKSDNLKLLNIGLLHNSNNRIKLLKTLEDFSNESVIKAFNEIGIDIINNIRNSNSPDFNFNGPQKYKNVGLPDNMTFGIEIETVGDFIWLVRQHTKVGNNWSVKFDGSLGDDGIEIASPILSDNEKDINSIYAIEKLRKDLGLTEDSRCGGHVHFGSNYLTMKQSYFRLIELWTATEEILYKICNKAGENERSNALFYAMPLLNISTNLGIDDAYLENLQSTREKLRKFSKDDKHSSINFSNLGNRKNTVEFRIANCPSDADTWIDNIRLFGRYMCLAEELAQIDVKPNKSPEDDKKAYFAYKIHKGNLSEEKKLKYLLGLLFSKDEKEFRKIYERRYNENKNQDIHFNFRVADFGISYQGIRYEISGQNIESEPNL